MQDALPCAKKYPVGALHLIVFGYEACSINNNLKDVDNAKDEALEGVFAAKCPSLILRIVDVLQVVVYAACFVAKYDKAHKLVVFPRTKGTYILFERSVCQVGKLFNRRDCGLCCFDRTGRYALDRSVVFRYLYPVIRRGL